MSEQETSGVVDAILAAGGQGVLAHKLGVSHQAVSRWVKCGWIPVAHIVQVERLYGVPRIRLIHPKHKALLSPEGN